MLQNWVAKSCPPNVSTQQESTLAGSAAGEQDRIRGSLAGTGWLGRASMRSRKQGRCKLTDAAGVVLSRLPVKRSRSQWGQKSQSGDRVLHVGWRGGNDVGRMDCKKNAKSAAASQPLVSSAMSITVSIAALQAERASPARGDIDWRMVLSGRHKADASSAPSFGPFHALGRCLILKPFTCLS